MTQAATQYLASETARLTSTCLSAKNSVSRAKTMADVSRAMNYPVPNVLRGMRNSIPVVRELKHFAETKMSDLLDTQLDALKKITDTDELKQAIGRLRSREWEYLRGDYPSLSHRAKTEAEKLLGRARSAALPRP